MLEFHTVTNVRKVRQIEAETQEHLEDAMELFGEDIVSEAQRPGRWPVRTGASRDGFSYNVRMDRFGNLHLRIENDQYYATYVENAPQNRRVLARIIRDLDPQDYV